MSRVLPYPVLTGALLLMWMLLTSFSPGQFLLGDFADHSADDAALRIDGQRHRQTGNSRIGQHESLGVDELGIGDTCAHQEVRRSLGTVLSVDS